jgi:hypothetical protein
VRDDLAVDPGLADPPGDELGVLRPVVDDEHSLRLVGAHRPILWAGGPQNSDQPTVRQGLLWSIVRRLPYDDPGRPDLRSPARFMLWAARQQPGTLAIGVTLGIAGRSCW